MASKKWPVLVKFEMKSGVFRVITHYREAVGPIHWILSQSFPQPE